MQHAKISARGEVVAAADVIIDFQVGGGDSEGLGIVVQAPASAGAALEVRGEYPVCAGIRAPATEAYLPGNGGEELVARAQGSDLHTYDLFHLKFVIVVIEPGVQPQEL